MSISMIIPSAADLLATLRNVDNHISYIEFYGTKWVATFPSPPPSPLRSNSRDDACGGCNACLRLDSVDAHLLSPSVSAASPQCMLIPLSGSSMNAHPTCPPPPTSSSNDPNNWIIAVLGPFYLLQKSPHATSSEKELPAQCILDKPSKTVPPHRRARQIASDHVVCTKTRQMEKNLSTPHRHARDNSCKKYVAHVNLCGQLLAGS
ncbi:hypothetical protein CVT25_014235 [Psilocybe cyanescens]|uniref:Uncharacterized protein n=1 Tax=Psilocybe cyanescens TaxID=93625 RepID=A0A409XPQ9_PSICY|nr:hypothetical protein CVT25_014235 [Psilocybe cyanescens]